MKDLFAWIECVEEGDLGPLRDFSRQSEDK